MTELHIERLEPSDPRRSLLWDLRRQVLLDPFDIDPAEARGDDARALHFGVVDAGRCLAGVLLVPRDDRVIQMRQVVVHPDFQGRGLGQRLLAYTEQWAASRGFRTMVAHARQTAVSFYERSGYRVTSEAYEEVGLRHRTVEKQLPASSERPVPR